MIHRSKSQCTNGSIITNKQPYLGASADAYSCLHPENAGIWSSHGKKKGSPGGSDDPIWHPPTACKGRKLEAVFQPAAGGPAAHPLHRSLTHGISTHHLATPTLLAVSKTVGHSPPTNRFPAKRTISAVRMQLHVCPLLVR